MLGFELSEDLLGPFIHCTWHAGEAGHVDSVTFIRGTFYDLVQKDQVIVPFLHGDVVVSHAFERLAEVGQFVIVSGKKRPASNTLHEMQAVSA